MKKRQKSKVVNKLLRALKSANHREEILALMSALVSC